MAIGGSTAAPRQSVEHDRNWPVAKIEEDLFRLRDEDYFLIPTAEVPVTNLYRDETLNESALRSDMRPILPVFAARQDPMEKTPRGSYGSTNSTK